jgi:hypothetical protein
VSFDEPPPDADQRAEVARKVAVRRVKRRIKAAASIGLALMAGAFLACSPNKPKEKSRVPVPPNPTTPSLGSVPWPTPAVSSGASSPSSTAIVPVTKAPHKAPSIDKQEHRKGMPVPDNLLE